MRLLVFRQRAVRKGNGGDAKARNGCRRGGRVSLGIGVGRRGKRRGRVRNACRLEDIDTGIQGMYALHLAPGQVRREELPAATRNWRVAAGAGAAYCGSCAGAGHGVPHSGQRPLTLPVRL